MIKFILLGLYILGGLLSIIVWITLTRIIWSAIEDILEAAQQKRKTIEETVDILIDVILIKKLYVVSGICTGFIVFCCSWFSLIGLVIYFTIRKINSFPTEIDEDME
jgi:hypothetical protein